MKKSTFFFICFLVLSGVAAFAELDRRTTSDIFMESYASAMRRQADMSIADIRAEEYRSRYEVCDMHHVCDNATAEGVQPFMPVPILQ